MNQTKITVKVFRPMLDRFEDHIRELFLKRDAFLNHVISMETANLAEEMKGLRQSARAKRHISQELKKMDTKPINIVVDQTVADALNHVVDEANMVRDAFINRLVMYLQARPKLLDFLELPKVVTLSEFDCIPDYMPTSPIEAMQAITSDPMYYFRIAAQERHKAGLYLLELGPKLTGFSCYLPDERVPGTPAHRKMEEMTEKLLAELDQFEDAAFDSGAAQPAAGEAS